MTNEDFDYAVRRVLTNVQFATNEHEALTVEHVVEIRLRLDAILSEALADAHEAAREVASRLLRNV